MTVPLRSSWHTCGTLVAEPTTSYPMVSVSRTGAETTPSTPDLDVSHLEAAEETISTCGRKYNLTGECLRLV
jgi:hypothetical protein